MPLELSDLDATRAYMLEEFQRDLEQGILNYSKQFNDRGRELYAAQMTEAIHSHNEIWLTDQFKQNDMFEATTLRQGKPVKVPFTAPHTFAECEFNRFYMRGLCTRALDNKQATLRVFRARWSETERSASVALLDTDVNAQELLADLRNSRAGQVEIGLGHPNSGISVKLVA